MKTYIILIETRKGGNATLGPFSTFEIAQKEMRDYLGYTEEDILAYDEFDSDYTKGTFYSENYTVEITERFLK